MISKLLRVKQTSHVLKAGNILISVPFMGDAYFDRSVVLLIEHNQSGSFGIIINKKLEKIPLKFVKTDTKKRLNLYNGGPVEIDHLFFIHTYGDLLENNINLRQGLFFGGKEYDLISLIKADLVNEENIRFYIGYCGWESGQLEAEIQANMWVVGAFKKEYVFPENTRVWWEAVDALGGEYNHWLQFPEKAYYN
ncbi:MAG: YqgE/AlgH family protein [Bacteroidales bacterium]|nr:YqgE/AlgH family protein [Bacteroidales bacterium]MDD4209462.1 YqgE/AlgH family protein [Bacteroidales bacterium]